MVYLTRRALEYFKMITLLITAIACALLLAASARAALWGCGDGVVAPGWEQCDPGVRCVNQAQTLMWTGFGTAPSATKYLQFTLKYSVAPSSTTVYGLNIWQGSSVYTAVLQDNKYQIQ